MSLSKVYKSGEPGQAHPFPLGTVELLNEKGRGREKEVGEEFAVERDAYEAGFAAGEKAGMELGREKANLIVKRLSSLLDELLLFKEKFYIEKGKGLIELIVAVARKVVHAELTVNKDVVINVTRAALKAATTSENLVIKINPDDLDYLLNAKPNILQNFKGIKGFSVEGDSSVGKGGCLIETSHGEIDAGIEGGLDVIEKAMKGAAKR